MFGHSITLFKIFGIEIKADLSWLILAALITWSLAGGLFPEYYKNLPQSSYWLMGAAGALGLFLSIIIHELAHSLVARHYGMGMKSITLFIFGGVAQMEDDPASPTAEFWMAAAGPVLSAIASGLMFLLIWIGRNYGWPITVIGVVSYLAWLNLILAAFNLAPAFPLDGGRILRSVLWRWKKDLRWATSIAANVGSGLGLVLIALGVFSLIKGSFVGGLWWLMIGFFIRMAAQGSYQQVLARNVFHDVKVKDVMVKDPVSVSRAISLEEFVQDYIYKQHHRLYPVVSFGRLMGCITVAGTARVPREEWPHQTVGSVTEPCSPDTTIGPDESAEKALAVMQKTGNNRLLVVESDNLVGIIALEDMLKLLELKVELKDVEKKKEGALP